MFLHDINYEKFDIAHGDTLLDPAHWDDEPFEAIVSNPPYSIEVGGRREPPADQRPPLRSRGRAGAEVEGRSRLHDAHSDAGWLSTAPRRSSSSQVSSIGEEPKHKIRKYLIDNNYVDAVIQLPPDLFFGTTIATCIIVLKKSKSDNTVLFIDASSLFVRQGNKNKLTAEQQARILDAVRAAR
ncbi:MAG: N-6 DNA methylase [Candidatus Nanopelagicales bacterium]